MKRIFWFLFTYDQQLKKNHTRKLLEKKGPSTLHAAKTKIEKRNLMAYAYRTGTNNISLTFSTMFDKITYDCVIDTTRQRKQDNDLLMMKIIKQ